MKKIFAAVIALAVCLAAHAADSPASGTLDAAKEASKKLIALLFGTQPNDVVTRGATFKDGWAVVTTEAKGKDCILQLQPNPGQNDYGWEVKQYECHASSAPSVTGS